MNDSRKMVAEFDGCKKGNDTDTMKNVYTNVNVPTLAGTHTLPLEMMNYDTEWNWLMPVVDKINNCDLINVSMQYETMKNIGLSIPDINNVYHFVIKFIKWYNKNK